MSWTDAIEIVIAQGKHEGYRKLCDESNPDIAQRDGYRALMIEMATGQQSPPLIDFQALVTPPVKPQSDADKQLAAHVARYGCCH